MKESYFQAELARSFRELMAYAFYYKIPDPQYPKRDEAGDKIRRIIKRPYDFQVLCNGTYYAFESKLHKHALAFAFDRVNPHQIESLIKVDENDGYGAILINIRVPEKRINRVAVISVYAYKELRFLYEQPGGHNRKSLPFDVLIEGCECHAEIFRPHRLPSKKPGWDVRKIMECLTERRERLIV